MIWRFVFMLVTLLTGFVAFVAFTNYLNFSGRTNGTVFQQLVVLLELALASLGFLVALGFFAMLSMIDAGQKPILKAAKDIALSNADAAKAMMAVRTVVEAPRAAPEAEARAKSDQEKRDRMAAYRS